MSDLREIALTSNAWPFQEARALFNEKLGGKIPEKGYVLFETGYGPSGLPHIGTFGEVVRTTMVRRAFELLYPDIPTKLFCFSDDMDGLRKIPDNIPEKEMVAQHLYKSLTSIPDPFGCHFSFGSHNNNLLRSFLDSFGFDYEFKSATDYYKNGLFDKAILNVLAHYDEILDVMLPTLREERRATYSPILPISPKTGRVLQVPLISTDAEHGTVTFDDEDGTRTEISVTGGQCKLQWKADWAMRWYALGVDYEMAGKDLTDSIKLASKICAILGGKAPHTFIYELFLDDKGEKISKSKGNGLAVEEWLKYAPQESLALFMYQKPKTAKRLYFDVIPRTVDDYLNFLTAYVRQSDADKLSNPVFHIHDGKPPKAESALSFSILLNLVSVCHSDDAAVLWRYIGRYVKGATPETCPNLAKMVPYAIAYYYDFVLPHMEYREPMKQEKEALEDLKDTLKTFDATATGEEIQTAVYEVGKRHDYADLKAWFSTMYETLLGQKTGPRMGSFIALFGVNETIALIDDALSGKLSGKAQKAD